ncbi:uncharacterized protein LOC143899089 isoform X2 [Temnothorax americanus]|uniref:uncharacterized protein LOC143899089 isoform X2 n=1 Tax=Temnothorax americanus TaxID=1964332 RepID=UPI00406846F7
MNHIIVKDENSTVKLPTQNCRLIPGKIEYRIFYANLSKHPNFKNEGKKKRFQEIMAIIDGEETILLGRIFLKKSRC